MSNPKIQVLNNGMTLLTQNDVHFKSATVGLFIKRGSRHELDSENGLCHFLEHAVFKGTGNLSPQDLAEAFDQYGCQTDAFTTKEETSFSIKVLGQYLQPCLEFWLPMIARPALDPQEIEREKMVILEEIKMEEDNPEDRLQERCFQKYWQDHPLAHPILGLPHQVEAHTAADLQRFHKQHYIPQNMLVVAIGQVDHELLRDRLEHYFAKTPQQPFQTQKAPTLKPFKEVIVEDHMEQVNFNLTFPGLAEGDAQRWALRLLNAMLGGGMSSRLFQSIRERRGLAYSVGSFYGSYQDTGHVSIYGGCSKKNLAEVIQLTHQEIVSLCEHGPTEAELQRAKTQSISSIVMAQESSYANMQAHASWLLAFNQPFDLNESIAAYHQITAGEIRELARQIFQTTEVGYGAIGPVSQKLWEQILTRDLSVTAAF